ncbi:MAG: M48 family metallopeptidase [Gammaproteobacteria bacterium]
MRELTHDGAVQLEGELVRYRLRRRARRRHMHLQIDELGRVEVRAPWRSRPAEAEALVRAHADWIKAALGRWRAKQRARPVLESGARLPFMGQSLRLQVAGEAQLALLDEDALPPYTRPLPAAEPAERWLRHDLGRARRRANVLQLRPSSVAANAVRELAVAWYRRAAKRYLPSRLREMGEQLGLEPRGVAVRAQRTLWGSCTARGQINLNWKLVLLPPRLCDYVMVHELCHLEHLDHSSRFWARVARAEPDYRALERLLDEMQDGLPL